MLESTCTFLYFQIIQFLFPSLFAWPKYSTDHYNAKLHSQFHFDSDFLDTICKSCVFSCVVSPKFRLSWNFKIFIRELYLPLHIAQA